MIQVNQLKKFFECDVTSIKHTSTEGNVSTFTGLDATRDNAPVTIEVELQNECYSVAMTINGVMRDMGMFE